MATPPTSEEIHARMEALEPETRFEFAFSRFESVFGFWRRWFAACADATGIDGARRERLDTAVQSSPEWLRGWRSGQVTYVKARRNELDSAISVCRNTALDSRVRDRLLAPVGRNLAGGLRGLLYLATRGFRPEEEAGIAAGMMFELAAIRSEFPIYLDLMSEFAMRDDPQFSRGWLLRFNRMVQALGLNAEAERFRHELARLHYAGTPSVYDGGDLARVATEIKSHELHADAVRRFHGR